VTVSRMGVCSVYNWEFWLEHALSIWMRDRSGRSTIDSPVGNSSTTAGPKLVRVVRY
jgi:hypothetical protein